MSESPAKRTLSSRPARCESPAFDPAAIEDSWYQWWDENGFFHAVRDPERKPFTIMIPPPNVTGALHLGHALNNSLQDVLIRAARMRGQVALWVPGTDHAGVATQAVVERRLWEEEGKTRNDLGREKLIERIWEWKDTYEKRILGQLRRLGASLDWERTQFTMSPELSHAVRFVFLALFKKGLIYRGKRLINWSTGIETALSNDELDYKNVDGSFWYLNYPIQGEDGKFIQVATTRPETMLGDTGVAVHPDPEAELNKRLKKAQDEGNEEKIEALQARIANELPRLKEYASWIGDHVMLPLMERPIPIVGDAILADPEKGTGAVKVTPAHDPNDYACGQRNDLPMINILNPNGTLNENAGAYQGLHGLKEARAKVVQDLDALGLLVRVEEHSHEVGHCYRSGVPIEPLLSSQWFVKMQPLVDLARDCYTDEKVAFYPEQRGKDYLRWLDSTPDWCISRQIWWGHRIPIWYCLDCHPEIGLDAEGQPKTHEIPDNVKPIIPDSSEADAVPACCPECGGNRLVQDPDVLDTWFSSQLWPISTLGWPKETEDLKYFYPTDVLITARDILALWVARMVMMGTEFREETPFHNVLIHGTVQDDHGNIMSKSRGNGFDPLRAIAGGTDELHGREDLPGASAKEVIPKDRIEHYALYGADALRYGLLLLTAGQAQDIRLQVNREKREKVGNDKGLSEFDVQIPRFEEGRRFCNKMWQASRGVVFRQCEGYQPDKTLEAIEDRWLMHRLRQSIERIDGFLSTFNIGEVCDEMYRLFWDDFCSWYLEIIKPRLWGEQGEASKAQAQTHLVHALDTLLRLIHPVMPFLSEALWQELRELRMQAGETELPDALIVAPWPKIADFPEDQEAAHLTETLRGVAGAVNQARSQQSGITDQVKLPKLILSNNDTKLHDAMRSAFAGLARFVRVETIETATEAPELGLSATQMVGDLRITLPLEGVIDVGAEMERLEKKLLELRKGVERYEKQLGNPKFVERAPEHIVAQSRERLQNEKQAIVVLEAQLKGLQDTQA